MSSSGKEDGGGFALAGTDTSFASKSADIFGDLAALEKKHETVQQAMSKEDQSGLIKDDPVLDIMGQKQDDRKSHSRRDSSPRDKNIEGRDRRRDYGRDFQDRRDRRGDSRDERDSGGFRIPQGRPPRSHNRLPEHKRHPEKFTYYNLEDTPEMSDRSNSAAAFSFLKSLKKRQEEEMEEDDGDGKIVFRKPVQKEKEPEAEKKPVVTQPGKYMMPEYVIGQKSAVKKSKPKGNIAEGSKVDLGHLEDEGETDESKEASGDKVAFKKVSKKGQRRRRDEEEEEEEVEQGGGGGTKRKAEGEEEDEEEKGFVRRDRAAERRKKSRAKLYQRKQLADSASEDEEEWQEELKKAREEEGKEEEKCEGEESMEDMVVEGV